MKNRSPFQIFVHLCLALVIIIKLFGMVIPIPYGFGYQPTDGFGQQPDGFGQHPLVGMIPYVALLAISFTKRFTVSSLVSMFGMLLVETCARNIMPKRWDDVSLLNVDVEILLAIIGGVIFALAALIESGVMRALGARIESAVGRRSPVRAHLSKSASRTNSIPLMLLSALVLLLLLLGPAGIGLRSILARRSYFSRELARPMAALQQARAASDKTAEIAALREIASTYSGIGDNRSQHRALDYYHQALAVCRSGGIPPGGTLLLRAGLADRRLGRYEEAISYLDSSCRVAAAANDSMTAAFVSYMLAGVFQEQGDTGRQISQLRACLPLAEKADTDWLETRVLSILHELDPTVQVDSAAIVKRYRDRRAARSVVPLGGGH